MKNNDHDVLVEEARYQAKSESSKKFLMKVSYHLKNGTRIATVYLIALYYLSILSDLATTYLATPDLEYEANLYVRYFDLGWSQILFFVSLHALLASSFFLISLSYIHNYYKENNLKTGHGFISEVFQKKKLLLSFIMFGYFYKHLFNSVFISLNNYICYTYIYEIENSISRFFKWYIDLQIKYNPTLFLICLETIFIIIAIIFTVLQVRSIGNKYRGISLS